MPHQLSLANSPFWCGTSAKGAGPLRRSALASLSTPQAWGILSPTPPQCPWLYLVNLRRSKLEGHEQHPTFGYLLTLSAFYAAAGTLPRGSVHVKANIKEIEGWRPSPKNLRSLPIKVADTFRNAADLILAQFRVHRE